MVEVLYGFIGHVSATSLHSGRVSRVLFLATNSELEQIFDYNSPRLQVAESGKSQLQHKTHYKIP